jgi:hypothetical protein
MKTGTRRSPHGSERLSGSRLRATSEPRRRVKPAASDEPLELCPGCVSVWWPEHERRRRATESRGSGYQRTVGRKPRPDATPEERRRWGTGMVPGSVARNKGQRVSAEQVAAQRDKARRKREDDWPTGKAKPARLGESIEPAGMSAWVRDD